MKKILITTIAFLLLLTSCSGTSNKYEAQVAQLESEIEVLQSQVKELQQSRTTEPSVSTTTNRVTEPIKTQQEATTTTEAMAGLITEKQDINKFFILEDEDDKIELRFKYYEISNVKYYIDEVPTAVPQRSIPENQKYFVLRYSVTNLGDREMNIPYSTFIMRNISTNKSDYQPSSNSILQIGRDKAPTDNGNSTRFGMMTPGETVDLYVAATIRNDSIEMGDQYKWTYRIERDGGFSTEFEYSDTISFAR